MGSGIDLSTRCAAGLVMALGIACGPLDGGDDDPSPGDEAPGGPAAEVDLGDEQVCLEPHGDEGPRFVDRTTEAGLSYSPSTPEVPDQDQLDDPDFDFETQDIEILGGLAVADFDGDGRPDLVITDADAPVRFFAGAADRRFQAREPTALGIDTEGAHLLGASAADYDGDGDPDLLLLGRDRLFLFANERGGFTDVTEAAGLPRSTARATTGAWADVEGDGDLDLYVATYGSVSRRGFAPGRDHLLIQEDGRFEDRIDPALPVEDDGFAFMGGFFDVEGDGDPDLYVVNDLGPEKEWIPPNTFLRNQRGDLVRDGSAQLDLAIFSMGLAVGDYDEDGDPDLHVSNAGPSLLLRNDGETGFTDASLEIVGLADPEARDISWATEFVDVDNDGRLELWTAFGWMPTKTSDRGGPNGTTNLREQADALLTPGPNGWEDVAPAAGIDTVAATRTGVFADLDGDGFADLVSWSLDEGPRLSYSRCTEAAWTRVRLRVDGSGNRDAVGARVEALLPDGRALMREIMLGSTGALSSGPPVAQIGLGDAETVELRVTWPDGVVTRNPGIPVRRAVTLSR